MKLLFVGDIVGAPGRKALLRHVGSLRAQHGLSVVVANGENAAHGNGITAEAAQEIFAAGVDIITLGDHTFDQKGTEELLAGHPRLVRPCNYPPGTVGRGHTVFTTAQGQKVVVINLQGRVFMRQQIDCPFQASKRLMEEHRLGETANAILVDIHAEATSEKAALAHYWDGKATAVVGTHTHIPTADARIQAGGTAFQTDAGMCGDYHSSLGVSFASVMPSFLGVTRTRFEPASGEATLCGTLITVGAKGLAEKIQPVQLGGVLGKG